MKSQNVRSELKSQLKLILEKSAIKQQIGESNSENYLELFDIIKILQEIANEYSESAYDGMMLSQAEKLAGRNPTSSLENDNYQAQYWNIVVNILSKTVNELDSQRQEFNPDYQK